MRDATGFDGVKPSQEAASLVRFAGLVLDLDACMLARESGEAIPLTRGEFAAAEASLSRALSVAPDSAGGHFFLSLVKSFSNRPEQALAEAERALELAPNMPQALSAKAAAKLFLGYAEEAIECHLKALRLSPRDPGAHAWMYGIGAAELHLGDYEDAAKWLNQSIVANPNFSIAISLSPPLWVSLDE
jgi:tetratricopeptide (TPR) repeat protein